ncbi:MAG: hypothetical protein LC437_08920 [Thiohalomonas sp.]|nr:hypothetical protein [Thiohalomonas sp.]
MNKIEEKAGIEWLQTHLQSCYPPLLTTPWILDVDVTVKALYGHQEGAKKGYNPQKPGRPSHTYHTYTHKIKNCQFMPRMIALICNWWNLFVRLAIPHKHHEAITSRPLLLSSIGKLTEHARQKKMVITSTHGDITTLKSAYTHDL